MKLVNSRNIPEDKEINFRGTRPDWEPNSSSKIQPHIPDLVGVHFNSLSDLADRLNGIELERRVRDHFPDVLDYETLYIIGRSVNYALALQASPETYYPLANFLVGRRPYRD